MKFHKYIREFRLKYFKDLKKFSIILGVDQSVWRKIERGINPPPKKTLLRKFARLTNMFVYEEQQMYSLAKRWELSPDTNTTNHTLFSKHSPLDWKEKLIKENTPDYPHIYWNNK